MQDQDPTTTKSSIEFMYSKTPWDDRLDEIAKERAIVNLLYHWNELRPVPIPICILTDWGYRLHVRPKPTMKGLKALVPCEKNMYELLAWFVRMSGNTFTTTTRNGNEVVYWNHDSNYSTGPIQALWGHTGPEVRALIVLGDMPLGKNCKIVEKTETVTRKVVVCGDTNKELL